MKISKLITLNALLIVLVVIGTLALPSPARAALVITGISPASISNAQDNIITVSGSDFMDGAIVSLTGFGSLTTTFSSSSMLIAVVPQGIPNGIYTVVVTNPDLTTASLANALSVVPPAPTVIVPTATPSLTPEPPSDYERPVVVVTTYGLDQDTISPGNSFKLFVTLYNAGQQYATNVVAIFTSTELLPRETGGVVAIGEIAPGNHTEFAQPLFLSTDVWGPVASVNMVVTYTNQTGTAYSETFTITLPVHQVYYVNATATPTPTQTPAASIKPQLVITNYTTDVNPLQPGSQFSLSINVQNKGNANAKSVTMIVGGGSNTGGDAGTQQPGGISGGSGEFTNFAPLGTSNVQSLGDFLISDSKTADQPLIVNVSTTPGAYPLKISFVYIDEQNHVYVDDQVITLLVYRLPILEISFYQPVSSMFTGQQNLLPIQVVNLGRNSIVLGNMRVDGASGQFSNNSILVGNLDSGGYFTLDANFTPDLPGSVDLVVSVDYTNDFNQYQVITKTLTVDVIEQPIIEPPIDGGQTDGGVDIPTQPETFLQKVWRFILGLFGLDSGQKTINPSEQYPPSEGGATAEPIIIPAEPLKGP